MQTEKVTGRQVEITVKEIYASLQSLARIVNKEFDEKTAYRIGKLHRKLESLVKEAEKDRMDIFSLYGKQDANGNISIPQPGPAPVRAEGETDDAYNKRVAEHTNITRDNEGFQKDMQELLEAKNIVNALPVTLPAGFKISPQDRITLEWLFGDENLDA